MQKHKSKLAKDSMPLPTPNIVIIVENPIKRSKESVPHRTKKKYPKERCTSRTHHKR